MNNSEFKKYKILYKMISNDALLLKKEDYCIYDIFYLILKKYEHIPFNIVIDILEDVFKE